MFVFVSSVNNKLLKLTKNVCFIQNLIIMKESKMYLNLLLSEHKILLKEAKIGIKIAD